MSRHRIWFVCFGVLWGILSAVAAYKLWGWWGVLFLGGLRGSDWGTHQTRLLNSEINAKVRGQLKTAEKLLEIAERVKAL